MGGRFLFKDGIKRTYQPRSVHMSEKPSPYRWVILLLAGLASFPMLAGMTSFPIAAPQLGVFTPEQIADADGFFGFYWGIWIGFGLASFVISAVGIKKTLMVGLCCAAIPQLLIPFCGDPTLLKVLRFAQGLCRILCGLRLVSREGSLFGYRRFSRYDQLRLSVRRLRRQACS